MKDLKNLFVIYIVGASVRVWLHFSQYADDITKQVEVTTPLNSFNKIIESLHRQKLRVDPYSSDVLHESPLHLFFYKLLLQIFDRHLYLFYVACDIITAHCLYLVAKKYMLSLYIKQSKNLHECCEDSKEILVKNRNFRVTPFTVASAYLFNPYSIFSCVALTTTVFSNLKLGLFFLGLSYGNPILSAVSLALSASQSLYTIVLLSPLFLSIKNKHSTKAAIVTIAFFVTVLGFIFYACRELYGNWNFFDHTYGFILNVPDQQPNIGVFWYFFMEMFEHFRRLFIYSYQINVTILYFVPLTIKFRNDPLLLATCFVTIIALFKSYPCVGDFAFILSLYPIWSYLHYCMQQLFISSVAILVTTTLAPVLWNLWIFWGTANANFYFGVTLAFITANIFLLTDISFAFSKYEYLLKHGNVRMLNGKPAKLILE